MQNHEQYGQPIAHHRTSNTKLYLCMGGMVIVYISAFVLGVRILINPANMGFNPDDTIAKALPIVIFICCLAAVFFMPKAPRMFRTEGVVYEKGIILSLGFGYPRQLECGFDDLKGMQNYIVRHYALGLFPARKYPSYIIHLKNQFIAYTGPNRMKAYNMNKSEYNISDRYPRGFCAKLLEAYTGYLINGLTKENIGQATIAFGTDVVLRHGQLIYMDGRIAMPLDSVSSVTNDKQPFKSSVVTIRGGYDGEREKKITMPIDKALNVDALLYIINNLR